MSSRKRTLVIAILVLLLLFVLLALSRCRQPKPNRSEQPGLARPVEQSPAASAPSPEATPRPTEKLTEATLRAPATVVAGAVFKVEWTGPNNEGDFVTIVPPATPGAQHRNYVGVSEGSPASLLAPVEAGTWEVRYVTGRSRTVLGKIPIEVLQAEATVTAADSVIAGAPLQVTWSGPKNAGDFVTIVPTSAPDGQHANYANVDSGSPLTLTAPIEPGEYQIRYVTGQARKVLARRPLAVQVAAISLNGPSEVTAGAPVVVAFAGPKNRGDFITIVPASLRDGQHGNYTAVSAAPEVTVQAPIEPGDAEIRYMSGQGHRVLGRRSLRLVAPEIRLTAPETAAPGAAVAIEWTGPNHRGDYVTIVPRSFADNRHAHYATTSTGSPLTVKAPTQPGPAEIRYVSGQGAKVLGRRALNVTSE